MVEVLHARARRENAMGFDPTEPPVVKGVSVSSSPNTESKTINLGGVSARVDRVTVDGLSRTKDDIISYVVKDLFTAETFEDVIKQSHRVRKKLDSLRCFRNIAIHIDTSQGAGSTPNGYEVTFEVQELKRVTGGVTTHISNNAGILTIGGFFPNLFGRAESLRGEISRGSNSSSTVNISFVKPFMGPLDPVGSLSAFQGQSEFPASGYTLAENGLLAELAFIFLPKWKYKLQYEATWRVLGAGQKTDFFVRNMAGSTLKSALRQIISLDSRDSHILPSVGNLLQLKTEFAGLGGNVNFLKNEMNFQANFPFAEDISIQYGLNVGCLNSMGDDELSPADAFYLGGPLSLRGFNFRAVGPKRGDNFVGAKMYWATALHMYTPLPFRPAAGGFGDFFRFHLFANMGNIGQFNVTSPGDFIKEQKDQLRTAVGLGIVLRLGTMARAELNYCFPLKKDDSDGEVDGVQFGIGVEFL